MTRSASAHCEHQSKKLIPNEANGSRPNLAIVFATVGSKVSRIQFEFRGDLEAKAALVQIALALA